MATIFTKIINGDVPCYKIAETESCFAFLDINPVVRGHVLCVPKQETDYLFDLQEELFTELMLFARRIARALDHCMDNERTGMIVVGTEVPHAHIHLVPFDEDNQVRLSAPKLDLPAKEMQEIAARIREALENENH